MSSQLDALRLHTTVVADTGDFEAMKALRPTDATTNPSLILRPCSRTPTAPAGTDRARPSRRFDRRTDGPPAGGLRPGHPEHRARPRVDRGRRAPVLDTRATVERARSLIALYEAAGIARERVLIKIASTWEGIQAARALQAEGIRCNLTLLFSLPQAVACADAGVQLISPFVGRIYDWHKKAAGAGWDEAANAGPNDPGVLSVTRIYRYYKQFGIATEIMGASFRNVGQILALSGCDLLTISPELLNKLAATEGDAPAQLRAGDGADGIARIASDEISFRGLLNEDAMATEKLSEGIRLFVADAVKLDALIEAQRG